MTTPTAPVDPMPTELWTARLYLRSWQRSDAEAHRRLWAERDRRALRRIDAEGRPTVDDLRRWADDEAARLARELHGRGYAT